MLCDSCSFCGSQWATHYLLKHNMCLDDPEKWAESTKQSMISAQRVLQSSEVFLEVKESSRLLTTTTVLSPAALGVRCIFQSCCTPRTVSLDYEPLSTGKQLLQPFYFGITQWLRLEVTSGDCLAHALLKSGCPGLCPVGF